MTTNTKSRTRRPAAPKASAAVEVVEPVIEGNVYEGDLPTPEPEAPRTEAERTEALREAWGRGTEMETSALFDLGTARVIKARVAYMAAALGSKTGTPNNKAAMRILDMPQNTVRPYFKAGEALAAAGWDGRITAPTAEEIALVAPIFGAINNAKRTDDGTKPKAGRKASAGDADGEGDEGVGAPTPKGADDPVILADVINAVEALDQIVDRFTRECGFPANVAENIEAVLAEIAAKIDQHRVDGGNV
ncbi:hypothetical protein PP641_gp102 [Arthrobacter phage SilentRX]|uniref:Uncharacterized protein n=1 Tax=Arthrobacter phage SilentRX TaxID=2836091 RepID=A0A8F3ECR4_9CAUD|nr:hypothetical protein PP641_gp102 [Arthrobacter phage SilentRX]QWY82841.1 hypothetical protein SEA_SILENTRX_102 [Arthrobacter phage SilentRX]